MSKCTSIFGHNFQARYDIKPFDFESLSGSAKSVYMPADVLKTLEEKTYIHDICTRCGEIIKRST